jgi:hypothetical protein
MTSLPPSLGGHVCRWLETYLVHGPGDIQGDPIVLDDELRAFVWRAYELRPDGARRYRRGFLSRPKGRGKSELAAMVAGAELLGPVRFDHYADAGEVCEFTGYTFTAGEPVGRPVTAPEVLCIATEEGQAGFVYLAARYMLRNGRAAEFYSVDAGLTRTYVGGGGSLEPVTAAANSKTAVGPRSSWPTKRTCGSRPSCAGYTPRSSATWSSGARRTDGCWRLRRRIGRANSPWPKCRWKCGG